MKKRVLATMMIMAVAATTFAACGSEKEAVNPESNAQVEVTPATAPEADKAAGNEETKDKSGTTDYVKVSAEVQAEIDSGDISSAMLEALASDTVKEYAETYGEVILVYSEEDWLRFADGTEYYFSDSGEGKHLVTTNDPNFDYDNELVDGDGRYYNLVSMDRLAEILGQGTETIDRNVTVANYIELSVDGIRYYENSARNTHEYRGKVEVVPTYYESIHTFEYIDGEDIKYVKQMLDLSDSNGGLIIYQIEYDGKIGYYGDFGTRNIGL